METELEKSRALYETVMPQLVRAFRQLEAAVPPPSLVRVGSRTAFRYTQQLPQQAIVLKLARLTTGLQAVWVLLDRGLTQEAAAIQRILDEIGSDVLFLAGPLTVGDHESAHDQYLSDFFQEEFDADDPIGSQKPRNRVPRKKIRAYVARTYRQAGDPVDRAVEVAAFIESAYSGFVHAAGAQAMDIYGGNPPRFQIEGLRATSVLEEAAADYRNYLFRALTDMACGANALGLDAVFTQLWEESDNVARVYELHGSVEPTSAQ
jgi:hypothetical protein